jgi:hypothetical protein
MDSIKIDVTGDRLVGLRFDEFPTDLHDALLEQIEGLTSELLGRVRARIPRKTGDLSGKLRQRVFDDEHKITGRVDIFSDDPQDHRKAGALEYGSKGRPVKVKGHSMKLDHFWKDKLAAPITVLTKAYNRVPTIAEHAFERGALAAMQPTVLSTLNAVVERAVQKANA